MTGTKFWVVNKINTSTAEIFLYGYIDPIDISAGDFIKEFRQLEREHTNINVRINSGGGSVFEGLAIYNAMQQSSANIETWIDGLAASMASIIALAGKKCHMSKNAMIMTHKPSVSSYGNSEEHKKNAQLLDGLEQTMLAIYSAKTGKSISVCKDIFMNGSDNWFTSDQAKFANLVDSIYDHPSVEIPNEKNDAKQVWNLYSKQKFAAVFTNTNAKNGKENIETVERQLDKAVDRKIITEEQSETLKETFKNAPDRLQAALEIIDAQRTEILAAKSYEDLDFAGELEEYKQRDFEGFKRKFKEEFNKNYLGAEPKNTGDSKPVFFDNTRTKKLAEKSYEELDYAGELEEYKQRDFEGFKRKFHDEFGVPYKK